MIVQINHDYFVIMDEDYEQARKDLNDDPIKISEWAEHNGIFINGDHFFILEPAEVESIVNEMKDVFISRDNPRCEQVIKEMMAFLRRQTNAG